MEIEATTLEKHIKIQHSNYIFLCKNFIELQLDFSSSDESENFHKRDAQSEDCMDDNGNARRRIKVRKRQSHLKVNFFWFLSYRYTIYFLLVRNIRFYIEVDFSLYHFLMGKSSKYLAYDFTFFFFLFF